MILSVSGKLFRYWYHLECCLSYKFGEKCVLGPAVIKFSQRKMILQFLRYQYLSNNPQMKQEYFLLNIMRTDLAYSEPSLKVRTVFPLIRALI